MKDALGNELAVGQKVAWGCGGKLAYGLRLGTIVELSEVKARASHPVKVKACSPHQRGGWQRPAEVVRVLEVDASDFAAEIAEMDAEEPASAP